MKKAKKLLSVLLAIVLALSCMSVMASAAKTNYKTSTDLEALGAYSPYYGATTRFTTEERMSMTADFLDDVLKSANIYPGQLFNILGLSLTVDLRSINGVLGTVDNAKALLSNGLVSMFKGLLGIIADVNLNTWQSGMTREGTAQLTIVNELLEAVNANRNIIKDVLTTGNLDLGLASSAVAGLDLSIIKDIPGLIKSLIFPLFERWDDSFTRIDEYNNAVKGDGKMETVLNGFIQRLLTNDMSITSYKEDANGKVISHHTLPFEEGKRTKFDRVDANTLHSYSYVNGAYTTEPTVYTKTEVLNADGKGTGEYVYKDASGNNLQWYVDNTPAIHSMKDDLVNGVVSADLKTNSAMSLLYTFIPYILEDFAVVPVNGSLKKEMGWLFGASYNAMTAEEVEAVKSQDSDFFGKKAPSLAFGFSDYKVINGEHYWRYEDTFYKADLTGINKYFNIINWEYNFTSDFLKDYIPNADGKTPSAKGYTTILQGLNDILGDIVAKVLVPEVTLVDGTTAKIEWLPGDNSKLLENVKNLARTIVQVSPSAIYGTEDYADGYYDLMINSTDDQEILCGLAATIIKLVMPQFILPKAEKLKEQNVGSILAAVIRELATQFVPNHNFDKLIYEDYNTKTFKKRTNSEWLDIILTIGTDIGVFYLKNLADMGEDQPAWSAMAWTDGVKEYTDADLKLDDETANLWEQRVDYVIDWALGNEEYSWKIGKLANYGDATIDLATVQNPWIKLGNIFKSILPVNDVFNGINTDDANWLEILLRDKFVMSIFDLDFVNIVGGTKGNEKVVGILNIPTDSILRQTNLLGNIAVVIKNLLNNLFNKIANVNLIPESVASLDAVLNQSNLVNIVDTLIGALYSAVSQRGLLDPILPILNMFAGWKTESQQMGKPVINLSNASGSPYAWSGEGQKIIVTNNSSGMLLKHGDKYEHPYDIVVENISATVGDVSFTKDHVISPGTSANFTYTPGESNAPSIVSLKYHLVFKDGNAIGDSQTAYMFTYVTPVKSDIPKWVESGDGSDRSAYTKATVNSHRYTNDVNAIPGIINNIYVTVENTSIFGTRSRDQSHIGHDATYIALTGDKYGGQDGKSVVNIYPIKFNESVNLSTIQSGQVIAMGNNKFTARWGAYNKAHDMPLGNLYYANTRELEFLYSAIENGGFQRQYFAADADIEWDNLIKAMNDATQYVKAPKLTSTFVSVYTQENIDAAYKQLDDAYKAISAKPSLEVTGQQLRDALAKAEPGGEIPEINYQDYRLFEYWNYEEQRTDVRNRIAEYDAAIKNGTDLPSYTALENDDLAQKLLYYKGFLEDHKNTTNPQFLDKEIKYAEAQGYVQADYTTESWEAYQKALGSADAVIKKGAAALQSEVFNAKYDLMVAQNRLAPATATPELAEKEGSTGAIDAERKFVYGIKAGDSVENYFEATNGGSIKMIANDAEVTNGTGAKIQLLSADNTIVAEYTVIIFGDVNGDGEVNSVDATIVKRVSVLSATLDGAYAFAGDVNGDGEVDSLDATIVKRVSVLSAEAPINPYA